MLRESFLLLILLLTYTAGSLPSAPISELPIPDYPFGTRLFLTSHPNYLNLVWTCKVPQNKTTSSFAKSTKLELYYNRNEVNNETLIYTVAKERGTGGIKSIFKEDRDHKLLMGNFNMEIQLRLNKTLSYRVWCEDRPSTEVFDIHYKYWDDELTKKQPWAMVTVGSLGLFNTTNITLRTIEKMSKNSGNVLWAIPGGIIADHTTKDNESIPISEEVSWKQWVTWLHMTSYVTCCIPLVASPSELDLYPYNGRQSDATSNFRHFFELPFVSTSHVDLWYSFNHRNLHVVSICSYCDLSVNSSQHVWLEKDLEYAAKNTATHWIMVMGHEPIYDPQQSLHSDRLRDVRKHLDKLFLKYKVDFAVWSHERWYARSKPMINGQVSDSQVSNSMAQINGTVHYTCGTGGIPLQHYNMDKYNHTAYYDYRYYGVCVFERINDDVYESLFVHPDSNYDLIFNDHVQMSKKIIKPPMNTPNHYGRFMKVLGLVIVGGAVFMLIIIMILKLIQRQDPSFIPSKIRQVTTTRFGTSLNIQNIQMSCDELDGEECQDERDTVMLLEEEEKPDAKFSAGFEAAVLYR